MAEMADDSAKAKKGYTCPACGGDSHWNPEKNALICIYCGTEAPGELDEASGEVREIDLVSALRRIEDQARGWKSERISVQCQSCNAISVFEPDTAAKQCDFCGSAQILPYHQRKPPISPKSLLPFSVTETQVREMIRSWYASRWFAPDRLKKGAMTDTIHGAYIPYWTFDAQSHADWTAQSGYYYYVSQTYTDAQGNQRTRQVRRTRWRNSSGAIDHFFDDELVAATKGVDPILLTNIEPFPTEKLVAYEPSYVSGWLVEQYQIDLISAAQEAEERMDDQLEEMCEDEVPGDTHRFLEVETHHQDQTFKHILVPIWLLSYRFGERTFQVLVNGVSGEISGHYPKSFWKIFLLVISILTAAGAVFLLFYS